MRAPERQHEAGPRAHAAVEVLEARDDARDPLADAVVVGHERLPRHRVARPERRAREARDDRRLAAQRRRGRRRARPASGGRRSSSPRRSRTARPRPGRRARCGRGRAGSAPSPPETRWRPVQLGRDVDGEVARGRGRARCSSVSGLAAAKLPPSAKKTRASPRAMASMASTRVEARRSRRLEAELGAEAVEERVGRPLADAHRAVALDVAVAAHRAGPGAGPPDVAAQEQEVHHLLDVRDAEAVLRQAHRPARDRALRARVELGELAHLAPRDAALRLERVEGLRLERAARRPRSPSCAGR